MTMNYEVKFGKFNCWTSNFASIEDVYKQFGVSLHKLLLENIHIDPLEHVLAVVARGSSEKKSLTDNFDDIGADLFLFRLLGGKVLTKCIVNLWEVTNDYPLEYTVNVVIDKCDGLVYSDTLLLVIVKKCLLVLILVIGENVFVAHLGSPLVVEPHLYLDGVHVWHLLQTDLFG